MQIELEFEQLFFWNFNWGKSYQLKKQLLVNILVI